LNKIKNISVDYNHCQKLKIKMLNIKALSQNFKIFNPKSMFKGIQYSFGMLSG